MAKEKPVKEPLPPIRHHKANTPSGHYCASATLIHKQVLPRRWRDTKALDLLAAAYPRPEVMALINEEFPDCPYGDITHMMNQCKRFMTRFSTKNAEEYRHDISERLEAQYDAVADKALSGDIKAGELALKILDRIIDLNGLKKEPERQQTIYKNNKVIKVTYGRKEASPEPIETTAYEIDPLSAEAMLIDEREPDV